MKLFRIFCLEYKSVFRVANCKYRKFQLLVLPGPYL